MNRISDAILGFGGFLRSKNFYGASALIGVLCILMGFLAFNNTVITGATPDGICGFWVVGMFFILSAFRKQAQGGVTDGAFSMTTRGLLAIIAFIALRFFIVHW
jgi:hypothetical protein